MTPDDTARYHADRPGYELLDYTEVSLPVYKLTLRVVVLQHTPLSPLFEFVLKTIRSEIDDKLQVAAFLGIPVDIVEDTLRGLHQAEEISTTKVDGVSERFSLTQKGLKTVGELERIKPEQQTIRSFYDGLTRQSLDASSLRLLKGRDAENQGMREIPPLPTARIEIDDLDLPSTARLLSRERKGDGRRDLLAITMIERRLRLHRPAVAMVFQEIDGGEIELLFADDETMLEDHNSAFAKAEGPRKLRLLDEFSISKPVARSAFATKMKRLNQIVKPSSAVGRKRTLSVKPIAQHGTVRPVTVHEHPRLLWDAVRTAKTRLMIICPWITAQVVDPAAIKSFEKLLLKEVRLYVGYGIDNQAKGRRKPKPIPPQLFDLAERFNGFTLCDFGDTHEKVLIKDNELAVTGSFNWLSFRGDPERQLRHERSFLVSDPAFVESEFSVFETRFKQASRRKQSKCAESER